ncbi:hypothetical protein GWK47_039688 [Chionoecetes opilio]|uniref:Uncharacterized protein n=1 Tax=Chionoecetes opilio TaxID=41210 RepID=A0A8J4YJ59_CHIOP|nr:hypothetical protein GWK47_039688 [Chionoecetes opilio]
MLSPDEKAPSGSTSPQERSRRRSEPQSRRKGSLSGLLDNLFDVAHGNALTMMTNQGGQRVPPSPQRVWSQDVEEGWRRRFRPAASGDEAISLLGKKGRLLSRRKQEAAASCHLWRSSSPRRRPSSNTSAVISDEEYGDSWRSESCEAGRNGPRRTSALSTGGHAGSNQS